jgi:AcrR family transcriptional regulator
MPSEGTEQRDKRDRREEVKARLRGAMLELATERAFVDLRVDDIATAAGLSRSAFYFYYPDKRALLIDSATRITDEALAHASEWWTGDRNALELIEESLGWNADLWVEHGDLLRLTIEVSFYDPEVNRYWWGVLQGFMDLIVRRVEEDQKRGIVPGFVDAEPLSEVLVLAAQSVFYGRLSTGERTRDEVVAALTPVFARALYPTAEGGGGTGGSAT